MRGWLSVLVAGCVLATFVFGSPVRAASLTSHNIAYVFDDSLFPCGAAGCGLNDSTGPGGGAGIFVNALTGSAPGTGNTATYTTAAGLLTVNLTNVPLSTLNSNPAALNGFDTAIVYETCAIGSAANANALKSLNSFLTNNGKLMLFDADACSSAAKGPADWSHFIFPFATNSPGPLGASGSYVTVVPSSLTAGLSPGPQPADSVGDANVFTTFGGAWFRAITAQNINTTGIVMAYARTAPPSSGGLAIYSGEDFWFTDGPDPHLRQVFDNMLGQQWNPDPLPSSTAASDISLTPAAQTGATGGQETVTATVTDVVGNPQVGVPVTFSVVSGPNGGQGGSGVTSGRGQAAFALTSTSVGTDVVQATFVDSNGATHTSNTAQATFGPSPVPTPGGGPTSSNQLAGGSPDMRYGHSPCAAKPVNCVSGEFWHSFSDIAVPGRGLPLQLDRTYDSLLAGTNGPFGFGWTQSYNMGLAVQPSRTVRVTGENGSQVDFTPDGSGGYTPSSWIESTLVKNGDGSFTLNRWDQTHFSFSHDGQLLLEVDRNGYGTTLAYDGKVLKSVTDPAGRKLTFTEDRAGHVTRVTDPGGRAVSFRYDESGDLVKATDVAGGVTRYAYDSHHRMLTMEDPRGGILTNVYDPSGRVLRQIDALHRTTMFTYGPGPSTTISDPGGNVTTENFTNNLLDSVTYGAGTPHAATWSYRYDPATLGVTQTADPNGDVLRSAWDSRANQLTSTDGVGRKTSRTYDSLNDLTSTTDPLGVTTAFGYDARGNLLTTSRPLVGSGHAAVTKLSYADAAHPGDVTASVDPDGNVTRLAYNRFGNLIRQTDPLGNTRTMAYDVISRLTAFVSPNGNARGSLQARYTTWIKNNAFGQPVVVTDPLGRRTVNSYDADQNLRSSVDGNGHTTRYVYDADNELIRVVLPDGSTEKTTYDKNGDVVSQIDGLGHATDYTYDSLNHNTSMSDPLEQRTTFAYDGVGNLTATVDPAGRTTRRTYDAADELTGITYSDGKTPNVTYTYDADGQRHTMADGTGTIHYTYDSLNRLTDAVDGAKKTVGYSYDLKGQLTRIEYPGGQVVRRAYDPGGRLASVTDWLGNRSTFAYDADSNLLRQTVPSVPAMTDSYSYTPADQLSGISYSTASRDVLASLAYRRDGAGQVTSVDAEGELPQPDQSYGYSALGQLTSVGNGGEGGAGGARGSGQDGRYTYDAAGDISSLLSGAVLTYDSASELVSVSRGSQKSSFAYDQNGNRTSVVGPSKANVTYSYDQANRLTGLGTNASYAYNGDGLRTSKVVSGVRSNFAWDLSGSLPLPIGDGGHAYIYGPAGLPIEQVSGTTVTYLHHDQQGSTRLLTDSSATVVGTYGYDPYGRVVRHSGAVSTPLQYDGEYADAESGLTYLRARYYDPTAGQFVSRDPLSQQTRSPYGYVGGDPLNAHDPSGQDGCSWNPFSDNSCEIAAPARAVSGAARTAWNVGAAAAQDAWHAGSAAAGWVASHPLETFGAALGAVSLATGVGEIAGGVTIAGCALSEGTLAVISFGTGAAGTLLDELDCLKHASGGCAGFGLSALSLFAGGAGKFVSKGLATVLGYLGEGIGGLGFGWDLGRTVFPPC
jgi:RHS repeat-associated protein